MSNDDRDPPIIGYDTIDNTLNVGMTVVDFGDYRVSRGFTRRAPSTCRHKKMSYDKRERRVWCRDCEHDVEPFDAFILLVETYDRALKDLQRGRDEVEAAKQHNLHLIAARNIEKTWRSKDLVPTCPKCQRGLLAEDFRFFGYSAVSKELEIARRKKETDHD